LTLLKLYRVSQIELIRRYRKVKVDYAKHIRVSKRHQTKQGTKSDTLYSEENLNDKKEVLINNLYMKFLIMQIKN